WKLTLLTMSKDGMAASSQLEDDGQYHGALLHVLLPRRAHRAADGLFHRGKVRALLRGEHVDRLQRRAARLLEPRFVQAGNALAVQLGAADQLAALAIDDAEA